MNTRHPRLSEKIQSATLLIQTLLLARSLTFLVGEGGSSVGQILGGLTNPLAVPLNYLISPIEIGRFVIEPGVALLVITLPLLAYAAAILVDLRRLRRKEASVTLVAEPIQDITYVQPDLGL